MGVGLWQDLLGDRVVELGSRFSIKAVFLFTIPILLVLFANPPNNVAYADSVVRNIFVGPGSEPDAVVADPLNDQVYVTHLLSHRVSAISGATHSIVGDAILVGIHPHALAFDSNNGDIYVADRVSNNVTVISGSTNTVIDTISSVNSPRGIAVDPADHEVYVTNENSDTVTVIDDRTNTVVGSTISVGHAPCGVLFDPNNGNFYVANANSKSVTVIKGSTNTVIGSPISVGNNPCRMAFDSVTNNIYVSNKDSGTVSVISDSTNTVTSTISLPGQVNGIAFNPSNGNIYAALPGWHFLAEINGTTNFIIDEIRVGSDPQELDALNGFLYVTNTIRADIAIICTGTACDIPLGNNTTQTLSGNDPPQTPSGDDPSPSKIKPSFGGVDNMKFPDGLAINGNTYDLGNFRVDIPKNIADVGQNVTIKLKQQIFWGPTYWQHVAIYMNFGGKDAEIYNAHTYMVDDKTDGLTLNDPQGYIKNFKAVTQHDDTYVYTTFQFTAAKEMPDTSAIVSAWDQYKRVNNVHVHGAIQFGQDPSPSVTQQQAQLQSWVQVYENASSAGAVIEGDGYLKPQIFAHISYQDQVWKGSDGGSVKWLYDSKEKTATLEIYDKDGNTVFQKVESLKKSDNVTTSNYSWHLQNQLNSWDKSELKKAEKENEAKVQTTLHNMGYHVYFDHTVTS
jgi:YVTN family beta-propeller protein